MGNPKINNKAILTQIITEFGDKNIKSGQVQKQLGHPYYSILLKFATKVEHGTYSLENVNLDNLGEPMPEPKPVSYQTVTPPAPQQIPVFAAPKQNQSNKITDFFHTENLVPFTDNNYVEFGCYKHVLSIVKGGSFLPFYITGESGNGKTLGVEQACAKANRELVCVNITNETTEEDLMGSFILDSGDMIWKDGPVLVAMRRGAVLLLDEIDQATTNIMCLQTVLQNKPYYVKKTNEMVSPVNGFTIVATANTKGNGSGSDRFIGANVLNEAFLERFNCVFEQEYPPAKIEAKILHKVCPDSKFMVNLVRWAGLIRENYIAGTIERCITTRRLVQIAKNHEVFKDQKLSIKFAISRFDKDLADAMLDYYNSINGATFKDGLDEYLVK